jgi:hypothetical protein
MDWFLFERRLRLHSYTSLCFRSRLGWGNSDQPGFSCTLRRSATRSICCKKIPLDAAKSFHLDQQQFPALPITVAVTYAMAASFWNLLEKPFLRLNRFFEARMVSGTLAGLAER